jgi:hypothetical protein
MVHINRILGFISDLLWSQQFILVLKVSNKNLGSEFSNMMRFKIN